MFLPGDLVFCHGSNFISRAIQWASRHPGEKATYANHVAGFVTPQDIVEALWTVQQHPYAACSTGREPNQVWRNKMLTPQGRQAVAAYAQGYIGREYGTGKIALHFGDALLTKATGREVYFFRRAANMDKYPICSWVWAEAYQAALGISFGLPASEASPDDMQDYVKASPDWVLVSEETP